MNFVAKVPDHNHRSAKHSAVGEGVNKLQWVPQLTGNGVDHRQGKASTRLVSVIGGRQAGGIVSRSDGNRQVHDGTFENGHSQDAAAAQFDQTADGFGSDGKNAATDRAKKHLIVRNESGKSAGHPGRLQQLHRQPAFAAARRTGDQNAGFTDDKGGGVDVAGGAIVLSRHRMCPIMA